MFAQGLLASEKTVLCFAARALIVFALLVFFLLSLFVIWGVARSGFWKDDPKNWRRAFGGDPPSGVSIAHSQYWRTAHFSYEEGWYFELKVGSEQRRKLIRSDLVPVEVLENARIDEPCPDRPVWFVPKSLQSYEVWRSEGGTGNYRLFLDRATSHAFVSDCQY